MHSSYLLVSHGSRDPRSQVELEHLAKLVGERLETLQSSWNPQRDRLPLVGTGTLELSAISLAEQIQNFAEVTCSQGLERLQIIPLFLLPGVHVCEDIPAEVTQAKERVRSHLQIELRPHMGACAELQGLLAQQMQSFTVDRWILLSHGSRRPNAHQLMMEMATQLNAIPAYWSVAPDLPSVAEKLIAAGHRQIGILPYFLFTGGITDAIALQVQQLQQQHPTVEFQLAPPLGATPAIANLIVSLLGT